MIAKRNKDNTLLSGLKAVLFLSTLFSILIISSVAFAATNISALNITLTDWQGNVVNETTSSYYYTSHEIKPNVVVKSGNTVISNDNFQITYSDHVWASTRYKRIVVNNSESYEEYGNTQYASVTITPKSGNTAYTGSQTVKFKINNTPREKIHFVLQGATGGVERFASKTYDGQYMYITMQDAYIDAPWESGGRADLYWKGKSFNGTDKIVDVYGNSDSTRTLPNSATKDCGNNDSYEAGGVNVKYSKYVRLWDYSFEVISSEKDPYDSVASIYAYILIEPRPLTIKANNASKFVGQADPASFTYSLNGLITGETPNKSGALKRVTGEDVGTYDIKQSTLALSDNGDFKTSNYTIRYEKGIFTIKAVSIEKTPEDSQNVIVKVVCDDEYTYDGTAHKPVPTVKLYDRSTDTYIKDLVLNTDYTLSYERNIDAATKTSTNPPVVIVTAKEGNPNFTNSQTVPFTIKRVPITLKADDKIKNYETVDPEFTWGIVDGSYVGSEKAKLSVAGLPRQAGEDAGSYTIYLEDSSVASTGLNGFKKSNYDITYQNGTLQILDVDVSTDARITITVDGEYTYNGKEHKPIPVVKFLDRDNNEITLTEGTDYTVSYVRNIDAKTKGATNPPTVIVTGKGTNFKNSKEVPFTIKKVPLVVTPDDKEIYKGDAIPTLTYKTAGAVNNEVPAFNGALTTTATSSSDVGDYPITQGTLEAKNSGTFKVSNYNITYKEGNLKIKAPLKTEVTITAHDKYKYYGEKDPAFTFDISPANAFGSTTPSGALSRATGENVGTYDINQGTYAKNKNTSTGYDPANFTINYNKGVLEILPTSVKETPDEPTDPDIPPQKVRVVIESIPDATYDGKQKKPTPKVTLVDENGNKIRDLVAGTDYDYVYPEDTGRNTNARKKTASNPPTVTVVGKGPNFKDSRDIPFTIKPIPLKVTPDNKSMKKGATVPELTYTTTGQLAGETPAFDGALTTTGTSSSDPGEYPITKGTLAAKQNGKFKPSNYTITYEEGTLTITEPDRVALIVTWGTKDTFNYDGMPHIRYGKVTSPVEGHTVSFVLKKKQVNVGVYEAIISDIVVRDATGANVTSSYIMPTAQELTRNFRIVAIPIPEGEDPTPDEIKPTPDPEELPKSDPEKIPSEELPEDEPQDKYTVEVIIEYPDDEYTYDGTEKKPVPVVKLIIKDNTGKPVGEPQILVKDVDYTLEYERNIPAKDKDASNPPTVIVKGVPGGNVTGTNKHPFTIKPAPITVTAQNKSMKQGDPVPTLTYKTTGAKNNEKPKFSGNPTTDGTSSSAPGKYDIVIKNKLTPQKDTASGFDPANYTFTYKDAKLTITAPDTVYKLKVIWGDKDTFYYDGMPHIRYGKVVDDSEGVSVPNIVSFVLSKKEINVGEYEAVISDITVKDEGGTDITAKYAMPTEEELTRPFKIIATPIPEGDEPTQDEIKPTTDPDDLPKSDPEDIPSSELPPEEPENKYTVEVEIIYPEEVYTYDGTPKTPEPIVRLIIKDEDGKPVGDPQTLEKDKDYTLTYDNNTPAGDKDDTNPPKVIVTGVPGGNITGVNEHPFTINPAPLVVVADDKTINKGEDIPPLTYSTDGAVKGEKPAFDGEPTTTATKSSPVDVYPIVIKDKLTPKKNDKFDPSNYTITYEDGKLQIKEKGGGGGPGGDPEKMDPPPGHTESDEKAAAVDLRNGSKKTDKANNNIYRLEEEVIYYCDYMNKTDKAIPNVKMILELPLTFKVVSTEGGSYNKADNTITWNLGTLKANATGTKKVVLKYTSFEDSATNSITSLSVKGNDYARIYPYVTLNELVNKELELLDDSAVINEIIKDANTEIPTKHIMYMWGDEEKPTFRPIDGIRRAEGAMVLLRIFEEDYSDVTVRGDEFTDIMDTYDEARRAIVKASQLGVVNGYEDGSYKPNKHMTRAEFMKIIASYIEVMAKRNGIKGLNAENAKHASVYQADRSWSNPYVTLLNRLNMTSISKKNKDLKVNSTITRAEVAQLCNFYLFRAPVRDDGVYRLPFEDVTRNTYLYGDVVEATRPSHDSAWLDDKAYEVWGD